MIRFRFPVFTFLVFTLALLTGCGTSPGTNFYSLSGSFADGSSPEFADDRILVGIGPIEVSPYLERNNIVLRQSANNVQMTEFDQWIEPIDYNIAKVLAANLTTLLPAALPITSPWPEANTEYHVFMKVQEFNGDLEGNVTLHAHWGILLDSDESMPVIRESLIRQPGQGPDYETIAGTMSEALSVLSQEIAVELDGLFGES